MIKTLIIYTTTDENPQFVIVEGDHSKFNTLVLGDNTELEEEFNELFLDENGEFKFELSEDIDIIESKEWDKVAMVHFYW